MTSSWPSRRTQILTQLQRPILPPHIRPAKSFRGLRPGDHLANTENPNLLLEVTHVDRQKALAQPPGGGESVILTAGWKTTYRKLSKREWQQVETK